eukprot:SAG11_NODE_214_length_12237_cov_15.921486_6_plen_307_part_00
MLIPTVSCRGKSPQGCFSLTDPVSVLPRRPTRLSSRFSKPVCWVQTLRSSRSRTWTAGGSSRLKKWRRRSKSSTSLSTTSLRSVPLRRRTATRGLPHSLCAQIIRSQRWELLLGIDPKSPNHGARTALFPTILQPNGRGELCSPSKPNIAALRQIVDTLPSTREVVNGGDMKATLDARHPAAHDLFQWIITSNRTFLVKLPAQNSIKSIKCAHQFLMKSSTPEKEAKFEALRRRHPVSFVFHGSPMECWHAIARCSLKNVSKTSMMTTGAACERRRARLCAHRACGPLISFCCKTQTATASTPPPI